MKNSRTPIFADLSFGHWLKGLRKWLGRLISFPFSRKRFLFLLPAVFYKQFTYDSLTKKVFPIYIRNWIDFDTANQIFYSEHYKLAKLDRRADIDKFYRTTISQGKTPLIIDCGGNIGLASRYFSLNYPASKLVCVEPQPENAAQAVLNNLADVVVYQAAIGSSDSRGEIANPSAANNAFQIRESDGGGAIQILSVNGLLQKHLLEKYVPFIIKIDIEGFENELFSKNVEWVDQFPILVIELHDCMLAKSAASKNFLSVISRFDRDFVYIGENVFSISNRLL